MNAQSLNSFEQSILKGGVDLACFEKSAPLKTVEEFRKDWLLERIGKFTASEFYKLVTYPKKTELSTGAITYATEKVVDLLTEFFDDDFISWDMQWGMDHELDAVAEFEKCTGLKITLTGKDQQFIQLGQNLGGTPDGLIGKNSGAEIKCPKSTTHFKYLGITNQDELKNTCPNYYWQIQGLLYITGRKFWYFISYDPRYKNKNQQLHFIQIKPNLADQVFLYERLEMAIDYRDYLLLKMQINFSNTVNHEEVLNILKVGRTKLLKLRKSELFPKPIKKNPLVWSLVDIELYLTKKH